jgi:hypothetical protein
MKRTLAVGLAFLIAGSNAFAFFGGDEWLELAKKPVNKRVICKDATGQLHIFRVGSRADASIFEIDGEIYVKVENKLYPVDECKIVSEEKIKNLRYKKKK